MSMQGALAVPLVPLKMLKWEHPCLEHLCWAAAGSSQGTTFALKWPKITACFRSSAACQIPLEPPQTLRSPSHRLWKFCCLKTWDEFFPGKSGAGSAQSIGGVPPAQTAAARAALSSNHHHHLSRYWRQPLTTLPQRQSKQLLASHPAY